MKQIDSHQNFVQEYQVLLRKINQSLENLTSLQRTQAGPAGVALVERINRLVYHRKKLQDILDAYTQTTEQDWNKVRDKAKDVFAEADLVVRDLK